MISERKPVCCLEEGPQSRQGLLSTKCGPFKIRSMRSIPKLRRALGLRARGWAARGAAPSQVRPSSSCGGPGPSRSSRTGAWLARGVRAVIELAFVALDLTQRKDLAIAGLFQVVTR